MDFHGTSKDQATTVSHIEDPSTSTKTAQSTVTCMYQVYVGGSWRTVSVVWTKNIMYHSLNINVDSTKPNHRHNCKIDLAPWHFWGKKSYKTFEVDGLQIDVYWDLRSAKFSGSPEPSSEFYVALVCDEEVVLLIGDLKNKVYKRTKSKPCEADSSMFFKKEHVFGKKSFATRVKFNKCQKESEIVVESLMSETNDPEMRISIDGIVLMHIKNLQWKFRGNQTVFVNKQPIEVLWDVHAWLFLQPSSSHGLFILKPASSHDRSHKAHDESEENNDSDNISKENLPCISSNASQCCLFLYAWKIE